MTHKQFDTRKRITVYLNAEEYRAIELLAQGNVSAYTRKVLLAGIENGKREANTIQDLPPIADVPGAGRRESMPSRSVIARLAVQIPGLKPASELPSKRTCKHGKAKGFNCWQCGGLAQVESAG